MSEANKITLVRASSGRSQRAYSRVAKGCVPEVICEGCGEKFQPRNRGISCCSIHCRTVTHSLRTRKPFLWTVDENGCWNCYSHTPNEEWHPKVERYGTKMSVARYLFEILHGFLPSNICVRHKCDNPKCINPEHLEPGTIADNNRDKMERGRFVASRGEASGTAKITEADVREIRRILDNGEARGIDLAKKYNLASSTISSIRTRVNWAWLQ
jgi:hypothetical protein